MDDVLIWCYRKLGPVARRLGIQKSSRRLYERIAARWYTPGKLSTAVQNGRVWKLRREVAEQGEWIEFDTISWLREMIRPGMSVIDVGANVGYMTMEMAVLVGPGDQVIAIEPGVGNLEYLRQHLDGNGLAERVTVVDAACSDQDGGEITFFVASTDGTASAVGAGHNIIGAEPILQHSASLQVRTRSVARVSIDGLCRRLGIKPGAIKIDVEGAELLVMKGAEETLRLARPQVRVAFHPFAFKDPQAASAELISLARAAGYRIDGINLGETLRLAEYNLTPE